MLIFEDYNTSQVFGFVGLLSGPACDLPRLSLSLTCTDARRMHMLQPCLAWQLYQEEELIKLAFVLG